MPTDISERLENEIAEASAAVASARRSLAEATQRLHAAVDAYHAHLHGGAPSLPRGNVSAPAELTAGQATGSLRERLLELLRATPYARRKVEYLAAKLGADKASVRAAAARLVRERGADVERIRDGVFAYAPRQMPATSPPALAGSSRDDDATSLDAPLALESGAKVGRPPSDLTVRIDAAISVVLGEKPYARAATIVEGVQEELGEDVDPRRITDRLHRRSSGKHPDIATHGESRERGYSLLKEAPV